MLHKTAKEEAVLVGSRVISSAFLTLLLAQGLGTGQVLPSVEEDVVTMTVLADTDANKALALL